MKFMDRTIEQSMDVWEGFAKTDFLREMGEGTLNKEKFFNYIVQDSLYLREYLKVFAYAITKSASLKDMQTFYGVLGFVNDGENATRLAFLSTYGLTDADVDKMEKKPQNKAYCDFLISSAKEGGIPEILMAMLPCMLGYAYAFEQLVKRAPAVLEGEYAALVKDYTNEGYKQSCEFWQEYTENVCSGLDEKRKERLMDIFRTASLHELYFWQMAGEQA